VKQGRNTGKGEKMETDLIIGGASGYTWDQLKYWVNSIRKSDFKGDVVIVGTDMTKETIDKLTENGVELSLFGEKQENGDVVAHKNGVPHVERFFYMWNALNQTKTQYRYIITTDTRDVIFQRNPSHWLESYLTMHSMVCSSEGIRYKNEPWGNQNLYQAFGPYFHNMLKDEKIYNVGTIAGEARLMKSLFLLLFQLSINRPIPIVDQAVFNFLTTIHPFNTETYFAGNSDPWAIQLGTTIEAVKAGAGDLGKDVVNNPSKLIDYQMKYEDIQPNIKVDGTVQTKNGDLYTIVHQWDRVPDLKQKIEELYA
jgi:hypothetical protein